MTIAYGEAAFGLREVKLTNLDGSGAIALPAAMMMHFTERIQTEEFFSEGMLLAARSFTVGVDWELEAGGISLAAYAKLTGRSAVDAGTTPNRTVTLTAVNGAEFPYIRIYGRATDDGTGDIHAKLYQCKLTAIEGTFRQNQFWVTSCAGVAVSGAAGFYQFIQHESAQAL